MRRIRRGDDDFFVQPEISYIGYVGGTALAFGVGFGIGSQPAHDD